MATGNAINANSTGLQKYDGAGTFSGVTVTQHDVLIGAASNGITSLALTDGQLAVGSTGADPSAATLSQGTGITITNGAGSITINAAGGGMTWTTVTGMTQAAAVNNGYIANNAGLVTLTLPATAAIGDQVALRGLGAGGWLLAQNSGQLVHLGSAVTMTGTGGSLASTNQYDCITAQCIVANTTWTVVGPVGNITVV